MKCVELKPYYDNIGFSGSISKIREKNEIVHICSTESCRELFHSYYRRFDWILYNISGSSVGHFSRFLKRVENKLGIKNKSKIYYVKRGKKKIESVVAIKVSRWWQFNIVRKHFFTIALRSAILHGKFERALYHNKYTQYESVRYAVKKFMSGYTHFRGRWNNGFVNTFWDHGDRSVDYADRKLFKR